MSSGLDIRFYIYFFYSGSEFLNRNINFVKLSIENYGRINLQSVSNDSTVHVYCDAASCLTQE